MTAASVDDDILEGLWHNAASRIMPPTLPSHPTHPLPVSARYRLLHRLADPWRSPTRPLNPPPPWSFSRDPTAAAVQVKLPRPFPSGSLGLSLDRRQGGLTAMAAVARSLRKAPGRRGRKLKSEGEPP
jgi:hypothetical protein